MPLREEKIFYFKGSKRRSLLGFLHLPVSSLKANIGIVSCHPFADEQALSHRVLVNTSRAFAEVGIPVFRFDMCGCGDSDCSLEEVTITEWLEDLTEAIRVMKDATGVKSYALWGLRLGSGLALLHEAQHNYASFMILWQPVINFSEYIRHFIRRESTLQLFENSNNKSPSVAMLCDELNNEGVVDIIGHPISKKLYESFLSIDNKPLKLMPACKVLLCSISLMERPSFFLKRYYENLRHSNDQVQFIHIKAEPFWDRSWRWHCQEVTDATLKWVKSEVL